MTPRRPDFDELVGEGLTDLERRRLREVHELLVAAGPPPEIPPALAAPPAPPRARIVTLPRRYRAAIAGLAAVVAVALFGAGYAIGRGTSPSEAFRVPMTGAAGVSAELTVFAADEAGNWPMELVSRGLDPLPDGRRYELWLTKAGRPVEQCGTFVVAGQVTEVPLNAPYRLKEYDGWVVVEQGSTTPVLRTATV